MISQEDFERAREALREADRPDEKLFLHYDGTLIGTSEKGTRVISRMPLQAPTEARGEFNGGESWGSSP